jgi:crotonobetainyl-CoA:carnitine CoA-transferase CaiB-like acyl-CoA transferase
MTGVLTGVRVVELASWTYVPTAGVALADWGADVIKVESVVGGDLTATAQSCSLPSNASLVEGVKGKS